MIVSYLPYTIDAFMMCDGILIRCKLYSKQQQEVPVTPPGGVILCLADSDMITWDA